MKEFYFHRVNTLLAATFLFAIAITCSFPKNGLSDEKSFNELIAPTIKTYCAKCHGSNEPNEEVNLLDLKHANAAKNTELIQSLIDVLDLEEMPPDDEPQPTPELRAQVVKELKAMFRVAVGGKKKHPHAPVRRMNRFQYHNAVTDLLDLKCIVYVLPERMMRIHKDYFKPETGRMAKLVTVGSRPLGKSQMIEKRLAGVAAFPQDLRAEHGFDNRGDHLSLSPLLMESFLKLGQSITKSPDFGPKNVGIWKTFFKDPSADKDQKTEIRLRLKLFLTKAFRRPVEETVLARYASYVEGQLESGVSYTDAMKNVTAATLSSPKFLYIYDVSGKADAAETIDSYEIASRLAFFLWGSLPDQELLNLASTGELMNPQTLDFQVDRMLKDRKIKRFCDSFPSQWLQLERIVSSTPNPEKYPGFYFSKYRNSMHMMLEPLLLFETVLIENLPITQLIDSDFTYRSVLLEKAYGTLGNDTKGKKGKGGQVTVLQFRRVPISDRRSGGVITNAAVMTMTSGPERTQPITRGAWLAGVIFNNPPEPPPADVPALDESPEHGELDLTLRERLAIHRKRADCKGCHEQIDPLGFALENYDAIGKWRDKYENDRDVDMQGKLFRRHEFSDITQFKDAILNEKDRFARGLAGHVLSFALARELGPSDQLALDEIVAETAEDNYKIKTLLKQVIKSEPFRSKSNSPTDRVPNNSDTP